MMQFRSFLHCSLPMTSPPSAVNFTAISSSVIGSRGSPLGTSTRVECDLPSFVVIVTRLGWNLGKSASNSSFAHNFHLVHDRNERLVQHALFFELQRRYHAIDQPDGHAIRQRMIGGFLRVGPILVRIAKDVGGARDHFDFDFLHVVGLDLVFLDRLHHGGERRVTERFDRETLHSAIEDAVMRLR